MHEKDASYAGQNKPWSGIAGRTFRNQQENKSSNLVDIVAHVIDFSVNQDRLITI